MNKIIKNSASCLLCNDEIESKHVHDYVSCKCGNIAVDGGKDYLRRSFASDDWKETSVHKTGKQAIIDAKKDLYDARKRLLDKK